MGEPVLSPAELSALLTPDEPKRGGRQVIDHDLTRASRVAGELLRQLSRLHQSLTLRLGAALGRQLRLDITVNAGGVTEQSFAAYRSSLGDGAAMHVLALKPTGETGLLVLDGLFFAGCLDRLLGGVGRAPTAPKPITDLDRDMMETVISTILTTWSAVWKDVLTIEAELVRVVSDPAELEDLPSAESVLTMDVRVSGPGSFSGGSLAITVPLVALEDALVKLGKPPRFAAPRRPQTADQRQFLERGLGGSDLPLVVTLGTTTLTLAEVLALQAGDVLVLDQSPSDPMVGTVGGKVRLLAKPGRVGRRLAVVVHKTLAATPHPSAAPAASSSPSPTPSPTPSGASARAAEPSPRPAAGKEATHGR